MTTQSSTTQTYRIWIAGDYQDAVRSVREYCEAGDCFAIQPASYVYTGGMEDGVCVTRVNYPRFPRDKEQMETTVKRLAEHLRERLYQDSFTIEGPEKTIWYSRRDG